MSLGEHLIEFRNRLMISAIAIAIGLVAGWFLSDWVWEMLRQPVYNIVEEQGRNAQINYDDITGSFDLKVQISLFIAIILACPVWLYQIWAFLAPGLTRREKLYGVAFLGVAVPLFLAGAFAGWLVIPNIVELLTGFAPKEDAAFISARRYLDFSIKLLLAVGIGFVMPLFLVMLNFLGVLRGKSILKSWRIALLCIVLFAGIATPAADLMSMFLLAAPIVVLYFGAAGIAILHDRRADKKQAAVMAEYGIGSDASDPRTKGGAEESA
ncbi:twin-arginine translocase subunit TatC [Leucobacter sp. wl10]|nr:twin-arginine translocase subunit TatC [Leucobacter sp. wl10]